MAMKAPETVASIDTGHTDRVHFSAANHNETKLATCSGDGTVRVFDVNFLTGAHTFVAELKGHEAPVWKVGWAPRDLFLASCSYDRRVIIWKSTEEIKPDESKAVKWESSFVYDGHSSAVNGLDWAPEQWGIMLACGSSDTCITVLSLENNSWISYKIPNAHTLGCNAISWCKYRNNCHLTTEEKLVKRFASGGCDNFVKIWRYREETSEWVEEHKLEGHSDWVRDVSWSPDLCLKEMKIATCSQRRVIIWINKEGDGKSWVPEVLPVFDDEVYHVSWNFLGEVLTVSGGGGNQFSFWKRPGMNNTGKFECISNRTIPFSSTST